MDNRNSFNKILNSFQDKYTLYCRNTISNDSDRLRSELERNDSLEINGSAQIIAKLRGMYIQEQGEKAIEIFMYYLKAYKSPPLDKNSVTIILDRVRKSLESTAQFARTRMRQYAASKGMERQLNIDTYPIKKELEDRIYPILEKMRIEINEYNITSEISLSSNESNNNAKNDNNIFTNLIERYKSLLKSATYENRYKGDYQTLKIEAETIIEKEFGKEGLKNFKGLPKVKTFISGAEVDMTIELKNYKEEIEKIISKLEGCKNLMAQNVNTNIKVNNQNKSNKIFIGHGRSSEWRELKDFIVERLNLEYEEFNRESVAGKANKERLLEMLNNSCFALLIMTGEDEQKDNTKRARENVVHEIGLFQGRLGFEKAIILLEKGCQEFSNIQGLGQIHFEKNRISDKFEKIREVLERESII